MKDEARFRFRECCFVPGELLRSKIGENFRLDDGDLAAVAKQQEVKAVGSTSNLTCHHDLTLHGVRARANELLDGRGIGGDQRGQKVAPPVFARSRCKKGKIWIARLGTHPTDSRLFVTADYKIDAAGLSDLVMLTNGWCKICKTCHASMADRRHSSSLVRGLVCK